MTPHRFMDRTTGQEVKPEACCWHRVFRRLVQAVKERKGCVLAVVDRGCYFTADFLGDKPNDPLKLEMRSWHWGDGCLLFGFEQVVSAADLKYARLGDFLEMVTKAMFARFEADLFQHYHATGMKLLDTGPKAG